MAEAVKARLVPAALWAVLALTLAAGFAAIMGEPWGENHDGRNAEVWTDASSALRASPIASRFGALHEDGWAYTHHPPLIIAETAVAEGVFGERPWAARLPAMLGTIAAVVLMDRVLRREGIGATGRAVGCLVGFGTPMVFAYGAMLDTPITSLPFGVLCLLVWQRQRDGDAATWERPVSLVLVVLAGWQAALLGFLTLLPRSGRTVWSFVGAGSGVVLILGWQVWAGGLEELWRVFGQRAGTTEWGHPMSPLEAVGNQSRSLSFLVSPVAGLIGVAGLICAARVRRYRGTLALVAGVALLYPLATTNALGHHDYWMFWLVLPLTFGGAVLAHEGRWAGIDLRRVVAVGAVAVAVLAVAVPTPSVRERQAGIDYVESRTVAATE